MRDEGDVDDMARSGSVGSRSSKRGMNEPVYAAVKCE